MEYSQELRNLIVATLLKEDKDRPTTANILDMPFVEKYMAEFIKSKGTALTHIRAFEKQATATAQLSLPAGHPAKGAAEETKARALTAKQKLQLKKEEETRKKIDEMKIAAKGAYQQMAEYVATGGRIIIGPNKENNKNSFLAILVLRSMARREFHHLLPNLKLRVQQQYK